VKLRSRWRAAGKIEIPKPALVKLEAPRNQHSQPEQSQKSAHSTGSQAERAGHQGRQARHRSGLRQPKAALAGGGLPAQSNRRESRPQPAVRTWRRDLRLHAKPECTQ